MKAKKAQNDIEHTCSQLIQHTIPPLKMLVVCEADFTE
jgi:hypothetical protein